MNILFSCIGRRGYIADYFRPHLESGDYMIGTSNTRWTPGFEHCDRNYVLPDIDSPNYISAVKELCDQESVSAILSFYDPDVVALARHYDEFLEMGVCPVMPRAEVAEICFDKYRTFQYLRGMNLDTADTYVHLDDAFTALQSGRLDYPLFVKPRRGFGSQLTFRARNERELVAYYHYAPDMIIQEELTGDVYDFDILNDLAGRVLSVVPWRKFRSRLGETEQAQTCADKALIDLGIRLSTALGHAGPLDADLFVDGGQISILEINLRFGGGYPVSHLAGADFPAKIVKMIRGEPVDSDIGNFEDGVIMMKDNLVIGGPESSYFERLCANRRGTRAA